MSWNALVPANPNQTGFPNQCLGQAQRVFGAPGTHYCARDAWDDAALKHGDRDLPSVPVPVWFANTLTIGNETRDFGHVAVWFPDRGQFLNVPASGNGQKWLNSIDEVNRWNGCDGYLGWTEDINGLRVAEYVGAPAPAPAPSGNVTALAEAVIRGEYGNGDDRKAALGSRYDEVQAEVNRILSAPAPAPAVDINALADAAMRGDFGNGQDRVNALGANYDAVQAEVNRRLYG